MSEQSNIKTWPERIYLQHGDSPEVPAFHEVYPANSYSDGVTWCQDRIEAVDVEYVRADVATQEPVGWRDFLVRLGDLEGSTVNGNRLSRAAKELLAAAPTPPQMWKVLPSPARVTGEMLHAEFPGFRGAPWDVNPDRSMWDDYAERVNARLPTSTGEPIQEAKE